MYEPFPGAEPVEPSVEESEMFKWAKEQGVRWPKIIYPVRFPPGYIGSMAIDEIHPGERIIAAPNKSLFTTKVARDSELKDIFEECSELFKRSTFVLVTYMIWEKHKGPNSFWSPFIKYQPKSPSNSQDWSPEELSELQDPDLAFDVIYN